MTPELPVQPSSGAALRSHRLLQALSQVSRVRIVLVGLGDPGELARATGADTVEVFDRPRTRVGKAGVAARRGWPTGTAAAWSAAAQQRIRQQARGGALVVVDHLQMAPYLPAGGHLLSLHNAEASLLAQAPRPAGALARAAHRWDVARTTSLERSALRRAGAVVVVSERDAVLLERPCVVVPNGADLPAVVPPRPPDGSVLFVGALKYAPNADAVTWWAEQIWRPGMTPLTVVGSGPEYLRAALHSHPGLQIIGLVPEVGPWLATAALVVVPLRHGGGTRLKVLEALAWGRPVISTSKGVEGLSVLAGEQVLLAEDAETFRREIARLQADPAAAQHLADRGRRYAEQQDWAAITPAFVALTLSLVPA